MRNPWGRDEYDGPWSDKSAEMKKAKAEGKISHVDADDGSFYVPLDKWRKLYWKFSINYYQVWKKTTKIVDIPSKTRASFQVTNPLDQKAVLGVVGHHSRQFAQTGYTYGQRYGCEDDKNTLI